MPESAIRRSLELLLARRDLDMQTARDAMDGVMEGSATPAQIAGFLVALHLKGETAGEIAGMVESMREHAVHVSVDEAAVDTCGTGGDGCGTFNISTAAALVAAGAGCKVAKHGNRSASSRCGSADVLEALGVQISLPPEGVSRCIDESGIGFLYAPAYHPAMRHAAPVRRDLGVPTVFNILGPLASPARVRRQAIGVADPALVPTMAAALQRLGHVHALVFHGPDGMDEVGLSGETRGVEIDGRGSREFVVRPADLGLAEAPLSALQGGDAAANAATVRSILDGEPGAARDATVANAAAALIAADVAGGWEEGVRRACASVDTGAARRCLERLVAVSQREAA